MLKEIAYNRCINSTTCIASSEKMDKVKTTSKEEKELLDTRKVCFHQILDYEQKGDS